MCVYNRRRRCDARRVGLWAVALALTTGQALPEDRIVDVRQGTDLAIALAPDGRTLVIDLLGALWSLPVSGGAATPLTTTAEVAKHPQWSPDGRFVVYQRRIGPQWDVWVLDTTDGSRWAITSAPGDELEPTFADAAGTILFAADRDGQFDLWTVGLRGGPWQLVVGGRGDARYPAVSERGDIAYVERSGDTWSLRLQLQGTTREILTAREPLSAPTWRPGGGVLVFHETDHETHSRLRMLILSEDRVLRSLTDGEDVFATRLAWIGPGEFLYAADGQIWRRRLAARPRRPVHLFAAVGVAATPVETLAATHVASAPIPARGIAGMSRSTDGRRTAFGALGDIWLIDDDELRALTADRHWNADPVIAADGRFVVFTSDRSGTTQIYRVDTAGGEPEQLTFGPDPAYRPSLDATGTRLAYLASAGLDGAATTLAVRYFEDGTEIRGSQTVLTNAERPAWLETNDVASVSVVARTDRGREDLMFDASLRLVATEEAAEPIGEAPPAMRPEWRWPEPSRARYVIQAGRLFDAIGSGYQRHVDIHVEGERIKAIVGRNVLPLPEHVIDATELTVIPGLIDAHMHDPVLAGAWLGRWLLAHGVTTTRAVADDVGLALARAETWAARRHPGPRQIVQPRRSGTADAVGAGDGTSDYPIAVTSQAPVIDDPGGSGRPWNAGAGRRLSPLFNPYQDVLGTLAATARAEVSSLGILAPSAAAARVAGLRASAPADAWLAGETSRPRSSGSPDPAAGAQALRARQAMLLRLIRSGARVAIGSETPAVPPGLGVHIELELLVGAGIAPDQVLRIATIGGAIALGIDRDLGTVEAGKIADLVVLGGDPLANFADVGRIQAIVAAGEWYDRQALLGSGMENLRGL